MIAVLSGNNEPNPPWLSQATASLMPNEMPLGISGGGLGLEQTGLWCVAVGALCFGDCADQAALIDRPCLWFIPPGGQFVTRCDRSTVCQGGEAVAESKHATTPF